MKLTDGKMKQYIKENAQRIAYLVGLYGRIRARDGYRLGFHLKGINREFKQGVEIATNRAEDYEQGGMIWRGEGGQPEYMRGDAEVMELLEAVFDDEQLFNTIKEAEVDYEGKITWRVDECIREFDFEKYQDAYYTEYKIKLNPETMRVSISKPREYSRSVLVALNID